MITEYADAINAAETQLSNAKRNLESAEINWDTNVTNSELLYNEALDNYHDSMTAWLGFEFDDTDLVTLEQHPSDLIASWGVTLDEI